MADFYDALSEKLIRFIAEQKIFFVASAPADGGHVNLSPKGGDTFRVLGPKLFCYLDLTGSGNETAAHMLDNGRLTAMFCSFGPMAQIVRLYGRGRVAAMGSPDWAALVGLFPDYFGARQMVFLDIETVQTSCGYQVPRLEFVAERETLDKWSRNKGTDGLRDYRAEKNAASLDGLPTGFAEG
jgi:Pyridoxamine 5'-phosphate oxidase